MTKAIVTDRSISFAGAEVLARRYLTSNGKPASGLEYEEAVSNAAMAFHFIVACGGRISFDPPIDWAGGCYGAERT